AASEEGLDAVEEPVPGQGDAEGLPGVVAGGGQCLGNFAAVVLEVSLDGRHDVLDPIADNLAKTKADEAGDRVHGRAPYGWLPISCDSILCGPSGDTTERERF